MQWTINCELWTPALSKWADNQMQYQLNENYQFDDANKDACKSFHFRLKIKSGEKYETRKLHIRALAFCFQNLFRSLLVQFTKNWKITKKRHSHCQWVCNYLHIVNGILFDRPIRTSIYFTLIFVVIYTRQTVFTFTSKIKFQTNNNKKVCACGER